MINLKDPEFIFSTFFSKIEKLYSNSQSYNIICKEGRNFFKDFFPGDLQLKYWQLEKFISSVRVISDEAWIPWELIRPWARDKKDEFFLCQRYSFSRWFQSKVTQSFNYEVTSDGRVFFPGEPKNLTNRRFKNVKIVSPIKPDLPETLEELKWITDFFIQKTGKKPSHVSSRAELEESLRTGGFDILHISTHGSYNRNIPSESYFELENNEIFTIKDLTGEFTQFGKNNPIVILNNCESARQGFSLTSIQGWAKEFISCGASAFIGTLWKINSEIALQFSKSLYTNLSKGLPLGEAVKEARISCIHKCQKDCAPNCDMQEDPSWLSYQLYGHPNSVIRIR